MTKAKHGLRLAALRELEENFRQHCTSRAQSKEERRRHAWWRIRGGLHRPLVRNLLLAGAGIAVFLGLIIGGVWLRLESGPIDINLASPLLSSAIEANIGGRHRVEIGGARLGRSRDGNTVVQIRDVMIRDADDLIVASAPQAEVSISRSSLLAGRVRAKRLSLVGAELSVRIEQDGQVTISTGADRHPLAVTSAPRPGGTKTSADQTQAGEAQKPADATPAPGIVPGIAPGMERFAALIGWLDGLSKLGIDGEGLGEIGLKDGILRVDDLRTDKHWIFDKISFSINRLGGGAVGFNLGSSNEERRWLLSASLRPSGFQRRTILIEARNVSTKDLLLAARLDEGQFQADIPFSGFLRAEIGPDLVPSSVEGRIVAHGGLVGDLADIDGAFYLDKAEISLDWDIHRRTLVAPVQIQAGGNRLTLLSRFEAPRGDGEPWRMTVTGGSAVLGASPNDPKALVLDRIMVRATIDPVSRRLEVVQGDIGGSGVRGVLNGGIDFSSETPRLALGFAVTPMSVASAKKIWPVFVASKVRSWVLDNVESGDIERVDIATNAPLDTLREEGPPIPDDGLSVDVTMRNAVIRPLAGLPPIREADLKLQIKGRHVLINVDRGVVNMAGGNLALSSGVFEIPDTDPKSPPARVRFRIDGPVQAAAELLQSEFLRDQSALILDPATSKGNVSGQVTIGLPITREPPKGAITYAMAFDLAGFLAEKMVMGQKLEAQNLKVSATDKGYEIHGDVKIAGAPATVSFRKSAHSPEAELRLQGTLDEAARARLGFDTGPALSGPVPVKFSGKYVADKDVRLSVEADLTQARIDNLLPGWVKPAGKASRATFTLVNKDNITRFDDIVVEGSGANLRGSVEIGAAGEVMAANFPTFAFSESDKATLRAERAEGSLRVVMRGEAFDARGFVKSALGNTNDQKQKQAGDIDIDVKLASVLGFNNESLRNVDFKMSRREGHIRSFGLSAKIGRDMALSGDLRSAAGRSTNVLYLESFDAGALFRFTDTYPRIYGGQMWIAMDVPTPDRAPQDGILNVRDFAIRGEPALSRVVGQGRNNVTEVAFSRMRVEFTRTPGKLTVRDGVVRGPTIGATVEGQIDYAANEVRLRGTFVPLYGLNNALGQLPVVGLFLGGSNEGLVGITYEVSGAPGAPILRVNPISAIAPGLLRKFFEFPGAGMQDTNATGLRNDAPPVVPPR